MHEETTYLFHHKIAQNLSNMLPKFFVIFQTPTKSDKKNNMLYKIHIIFFIPYLTLRCVKQFKKYYVYFVNILFVSPSEFRKSRKTLEAFFTSFVLFHGKTNMKFFHAHQFITQSLNLRFLNSLWKKLCPTKDTPNILGHPDKKQI